MKRSSLLAVGVLALALMGGAGVLFSRAFERTDEQPVVDKEPAAEPSEDVGACCQRQAAASCQQEGCSECDKAAADGAKSEEKVGACPECQKAADAAKSKAKKEACSECRKAAADGAKSKTPGAQAGAEDTRRGPPFGFGKGRGRGRGRGHGNDEQFVEDHNVFFFLLDHRDVIRRDVTNLPNGIETTTESDQADVAAKIQEHVAAMYERVEHIKPIHMRDPLFRELFANAKKIKMEMKETDKGIRVKETSDDPYVAKLLQEHAKVVSLFIKNGRSELHRNHALPPKKPAAEKRPVAEKR